MTQEEYKKLLLQRIKGLEIFNRWEEKQEFPQRSIEKILEDLWELYDDLPEESKQVKIEVKRDGIVKMHQALSVLGKKYE